MSFGQCLIAANLVVIVSVYGSMALLPDSWIIAIPFWVMMVVWVTEWFATLGTCIFFSLRELEAKEKS